MENKIIFLDHDGTLTFRSEENSFEYKDGLKEFLEFVTDHFKVFWCSGLDHDYLMECLRQENIDQSLLDKIDYFDFEYGRGKAECILDDYAEFLLIDDDAQGREDFSLRSRGLEEMLLKSVDSDPGNLMDIMKELTQKLGK